MVRASPSTSLIDSLPQERQRTMYQLAPITISPEHIIAAAQKIANTHDDAWKHTEAQWLESVEHYLRVKINDLLVDVDFHAGKDFESEFTCDHPNCFDK